jgi:predicted MFS family arabinose efflux permease
LLGDWFNLIASASLIALLTKSGLAIGALFVIRMLAPFLISPIAGVVADRYNRKGILISTDIMRAITVVGFLFVRDAGDLWLLYTLTAIQLGIGGFFFPTRNAILPDLVKPEAIGTANALLATTWSVMLAFGAALGGFASGTWGIYPAFMLDGLTFLISAVFILRIKADTRPPGGQNSTLRAALSEYGAGLRYLGRHKDVLVLAVQKAAMAMAMFASFQVIQVPLAESVFVIGAGGGISLGILYTVNGIGSGIGPIAVRRITGDDPAKLRRTITWAYLVSAAGLALAAPLVSFPVLLIGHLIRSAGGGIIWVFSTQLLLHKVPADYRGRIFSNEAAFFALGSSIGAGLMGGLLETPLAISGSIWVMAAMALSAGLLWSAWLLRRNKRGQVV